MVNAEVGRLLNSVGECVANIVGEQPDGAYLYVEYDGGCEAGVFHDQGGSVAYFDPDSYLMATLFQLWNASDVHSKWDVMEYEITGDTFDARFGFADSFDPEETSHDRRERALRARYGDKPVIYPLMDDKFHELSEDDLSSD